MHIASKKNNNSKIIKELKEGGADVDAKTSGRQGKTPLELAVDRDNLENVKALIKGGADLSVLGGSFSVLHTAIKNVNLEMVEALVKAGADLNVKDSHFNLTPLDLAETTNINSEISKLLRQKGQDVSQGKQSLGHMIIARNTRNIGIQSNNSFRKESQKSKQVKDRNQLGL